MLRLVKAYLSFLLRSTNEHGVHSPFVYNLVTKCFYDKKEYQSYPLLKQYRQSLLKDKRKIRVSDFGAGSRVFRSGERRISKIAKSAGICPKRARLLNRLVRYLEVENVLELGTSVGLATAAMAIENEVEVTTIEGCPETARIAEEKFQQFGLKNVVLKVGKFEEEIQNSKFKIQNVLKTGNRQPINDNSQPGTGNRQQIQNSNGFPEEERATHNRQSTTGNPEPTTPNSELLTHHFDLLYIDGNHQKEATLAYFHDLLQAVHNDSVMIFDDIHWSQGMEEAWEEIKRHPSVRVSIDTFQWGLVFFRREQEKEHFVIRV